VTSRPEPPITLRGVDKSYWSAAGPLLVIDGLDLTVDHGEIVAVAGRSGSGKTTLLTLIAGFEPPDAGLVEVLGQPSHGHPPSWQELALVPQSLAMVDELTVGENLDLPSRLGAVAGSIDRAEVLEQLALEHLVDRFTDEISLGEQQRVALARAAMTRPRVLIADEPVSHQNEGWARTAMLIVERLADSGTACLFATHNAVAFESAHRILELRDGRLLPVEHHR
jgi:ABC-type lipoprotein export system ATPase subunit